ncbi:hypothetical protein PMAYCL1PPCAC_02356, partial [Pristionchus mayeri]
QILPIILVSSVLCGKLVPIVRMISREGLSTYSLNGNETIEMEKKGFEKIEESGYLLSVDQFDRVKENCPHLRAVIRYSINSRGKTLYRLATTYDITSKSVLGFAV